MHRINEESSNNLENGDMKTIQISENSVIINSIKCIKHEIDVPTSICKGMLLETLKKRMMRGEVVRFCYQKLDGTIRYAIGTLQVDAVQSHINGGGIPKRYQGMFAYLDLQKMAWRGFKEERIIGILD